MFGYGLKHNVSHLKVRMKKHNRYHLTNTIELTISTILRFDYGNQS
jgi:hypothetical protein